MKAQNHRIRVGIIGYGNLGRGVEMAISQNQDMEVVGIFTRRDPSTLASQAAAYNLQEVESFQDKIDVMVLCGGSAKDLPEQVPYIAKYFHTVDSFDTHAKIPEYLEVVDQAASASGKVSVISTGWDPGLFSLLRLLGQSVLPEGGDTHTFWGKGLSQGHSDALRRLEGVKGAVQYTIPKEEVLQEVRSGKPVTLSAADKHERVCYVVADEGVDLEDLQHRIKTMPHYFADYKTTVHFISEEELRKEHSNMPHGGTVIHTGESKVGDKQRVEFTLALDSNPAFTASVLVAYARAAFRLAQQGQSGAKTVFDIPFGLLSARPIDELIKELL